MHHFCLALSLSLNCLNCINIIHYTISCCATFLWWSENLWHFVTVFGLSIFSSSIAIIVYVFRHYHISLLGLFPLSTFSCVWFVRSLASSFFPNVNSQISKNHCRTFSPTTFSVLPSTDICVEHVSRKVTETKREGIQLPRSKTKCPA